MPICLIENKPNGKLVVREEAAEILGNIRQPIVVVAIVGPYRTGKSYLMNQLAGKSKGFSLGYTVEAKTKGIWMWLRPHPYRPGCTLVLLDTEGLGDMKKSNTQNDSWIFALAILLSSTLVYNSFGVIDYNALEKLQYVTELTKRIKATSSSGEDQQRESSAEFIRSFPDFIWALRDFTLTLEMDGHPITEDEYLEKALELQQGEITAKQSSSIRISCIRKYFPSRNCFTFDRPVGRKKLQHLEELEDHDLDEEFLDSVSRFCQHVWETSQPKKVPGGQVLNGEMLTFLMRAYVDAIDSGELPCLENAVRALSELENLAAVQEAISHYEKNMEMRLKLPTESVEEMLEVHDMCQEEAVAIFRDRGILELRSHLKEEFCRRNEQASLDFCQAKLTELSQGLHDGIQKGSFCVLGGYKHFMEKLNKIEEDYLLIPGKGIQVGSNSEKAALQQIIADNERSHNEYIKQLKEKMEEEMQRMKHEAERMIEHKVKVGGVASNALHLAYNFHSWPFGVSRLDSFVADPFLMGLPGAPPKSVPHSTSGPQGHAICMPLWSSIVSLVQL
uniref:GB1/RHD3-type G domain-containing protein n=1 Tax=Salvator merianae TaxID=96440 RepID=A0A8D0B8U4_SALMN